MNDNNLARGNTMAEPCNTDERKALRKPRAMMRAVMGMATCDWLLN